MLILPKAVQISVAAECRLVNVEAKANLQRAKRSMALLSYCHISATVTEPIHLFITALFNMLITNGQLLSLTLKFIKQFCSNCGRPTSNTHKIIKLQIINNFQRVALVIKMKNTGILSILSYYYIIYSVLLFFYLRLLYM